MSALRQPRPAESHPFRCGTCRRPYPEDSLPYRCPHCGGAYVFDAPLPYAPHPGPRRGLARYRETFPLPAGAPLVSLGEGGTPLLEVPLAGRRVFFKAEHLNPTGSFKDRGEAVLVSALAAAGVREALEDSSGNAGASFAAYAARAGIRARVFIPDDTSGTKRAQIEAYGAEVVRILGPRSEASRAVERAAAAGAVYASHAWLPHVLAGMATVAFELVEQLGRAPGAVVAPVGQGTLLLGMAMGFEAMREGGALEGRPRLVAVQARACAPLWAVHTGGAAALAWMQERPTVAEGIRIFHPLRGDAVLQAVESSGGRVVAVEEKDILEGRDALACLGFYVEPTSAVVWPALQDLLPDLPDPVVTILTGNGYKDPRTPQALARMEGLRRPETSAPEGDAEP